MSDSDLFISVSVISWSEYEIDFSRVCSILYTESGNIFSLVLVLLLFSPYFIPNTAPLFITHRVILAEIILCVILLLLLVLPLQRYFHIRSVLFQIFDWFCLTRSIPLHLRA